mgnify:FL=1
MLDKEIFEYKDFGCIKICLDDLINYQQNLALDFRLFKV